MSKKEIREYIQAIRKRYRQVSRKVKRFILDEFCTITGYNRKYAIRKLNEPIQERAKNKWPRRRKAIYGLKGISVIAAVWEAAGYPCSTRLKALLVLWMPWIQRCYAISAEIEKKLLSISPRQMDRRLKSRKTKAGKRIYGRSKPDTLLKYQIPIKTDHWDVNTPGWTEVDTVSHSGSSAEGLFASTVNQTDILTTWIESRSVLGKEEKGLVEALEEMALAFPFQIKGIDSDNGSEFVNWHLFRHCEKQQILPFRRRPYKKDDNAQTHVRKLTGWDRYDTPEAVAALNDLYSKGLNLFMPSTKS